MSIYEYNEDEHPGGFIGLRVAVMVNKKHKQKYYSFRDTSGKRFFLTQKQINQIWREARELEEKWLNMQKVAEKRRLKDARPTSRAQDSTGVRGITFTYLYSPDRHGNKKAYKHLAFVAQGSVDNVHFIKSFRVDLLGYDGAWRQAVKYYANLKGIKSYKHLLLRKPKRRDK